MATRQIFERPGVKVTPGFVQLRVMRAGKTLGEILGHSQNLMPKSGKITNKRRRVPGGLLK